MSTSQPDEDGTRTELSGRASDVVQARDIAGGVHFHGRSASQGSIPRQLPGDVRGFVNRDHDLRHLDLILAQDRELARISTVCVVVGTAGVGKTSFAIHWAHEVAEQFPDGQLFANLRGYDPGPPVTPDQVLERFLSALDVPAAAIPADLESRANLYRSLIAGRRILVVLDNASSVGQVRPLLPGAAGCLVLITSRSRLSGLVARDGAQRVSLDMLDEPEAVALINSLFRDYRPDDDPDEVVELVRLCARLPLALRIAAESAARRPWMPLRELIEDLRDESALWDALTTGDGEEADAIRSVFAWSYRALTEDSGRLFRLLGLHPGADFSSRTAAALADIPLNRARRLLDDLVGAHLLEQPSFDRYGFHDLLRAYAIDQVRTEEDPATREAALRRVLLWYLRQADAAAAVIVPGAFRPPLAQVAETGFAGHAEALRWYEQERANLVDATRGAANAGFDDIAWQLPACLNRIHARLNHIDDLRITNTIALAAVRKLNDRPGEAIVLESLAKLHTQSADLEQGILFHQAALDIRRELGDRIGEMSSLNGIGLALLRGHRLGDAKQYFSRTHALAVELADRMWQAIAANCLAYAHMELVELDEALSRHREAIALYRELEDRGSEGDALHCLSQIHRGAGRFEQALVAINEALAIAAELGNQAWEAWWLIELGRVRAAVGQDDEAIESYHRAAVLHRRLGDRNREASALDATGVAFLDLGRPERSVEFHRRAVAVFRAEGDQWSLAVSLANLATALDQEQLTAEAAATAGEAEGLLASFDDPAAGGLLAHVRALPRSV